MTNKKTTMIRPGGSSRQGGVGRFRRRPVRAAVDANAVTPASREETMPVGLLAVVAGFLALAVSAKMGVMMLYGDAVAHLGIARRIVDTNAKGVEGFLGNLGGVWLPLPHLLMLPFVWKMEWWQNGMAGAWPALLCFVIGVMGMYRLARRVVPAGWAMVATAFFGLNANLLYLATTPMTEPLFLALLVWIVLLTMEMLDAVRGGFIAVAGVRMVGLGVLVFLAVMTRYDGWVLGAAVWCVAAWQMYRSAILRRRLGVAFGVLTVLAVAGPLLWFWYNHVFGHDWLDFMRGPYSAKEIDRKTSPPGSHKYWGWHNPAWSLMLYARTAQVDAAWWETGWVVAAAALWGTYKAWKAKVNGAVYLLWLPLPFYVYSISYGSVPIFIPQLYPHSYYNSRYGVEMLPVLAMFLAYACWRGVEMVRDEKVRTLLMRVGPQVMLLVVAVNLVGMLHATPLVEKEGFTNSRGRLAIDEPLAREMETFRPGATILMDTSERVGALEKAGIPLKDTIGPGDYYGWRTGMEAPAKAADYVVAVAGDAVTAAVKAHPEGLTEMEIVCSSGEKCVRIYESAK